jgi:hypothetical protein
MRCFKKINIILTVFIIIQNFVVNGNSVIFPKSQESYLGDSCSLSDGSEGICQILQDCKGPEKKLLDQKNFSEVKRCGFEGKDPIFCCSKPQDEFLPLLELNTKFKELICENSPKYIRLSPNIVNGVSSDVGEFPHQVAIGYQKDPQSQYEFKCGGSIITERIVLTAAHCVNSKDLNPAIVRLGRVSLMS